jgi:hypothetical protein
MATSTGPRQRGTDVNLGLATTVEAATTLRAKPALSSMNSTEPHPCRLNSDWSPVSERRTSTGITTAAVKPQQPAGYGASVGLTWSINRYLDLEADASYEKTEEPGRTDEETMPHRRRSQVAALISRAAKTAILAAAGCRMRHSGPRDQSPSTPSPQRLDVRPVQRICHIGEDEPILGPAIIGLAAER